MEVAVDQQLALLLHPFYHLLCVVDGRVQLLVGVDPLAVQVHLGQVASVVANDDAVDVEHRHYLEEEVLPQDLGDG